MIEPTPPHGIQRSPIEYVVFAGNYREFRTWLLASGVSQETALFVADKSNLTPLKGKKVNFVSIGSFHLRPDFKMIMEYARSIWPDAPAFITGPITS